MTCQLLVESPEGVTVEVRGILDSASSASFVSERIAQSLRLKRSSCNTRISGIGGLSLSPFTQSVATFTIAPSHCPSKRMNLSAIVVPRVTCDLPVAPVAYDPSWNHLADLRLADPKFGIPGRVNLLLGIDIFTCVLRQGRRHGPSNAPIAFETDFGWVLAGTCTNSVTTDNTDVVAHHVSVQNDDSDNLRKFWEIEEPTHTDGPLTIEEKVVAEHFQKSHYRASDGAFVVPLPKKAHHEPIGESRSMAVKRFLSMERSLFAKNRFEEFASVMNEYVELKHAELVPPSDLDKPPNEVFYLPMHAVRKDSSSTTKLRVVFDASAKSSTGVSLNDTLLVGHTVHSSLTDVLFHFRSRVALITDVSKMYRAVKLADFDKDLHRFVWRNDPGEPLKDYRMNRVTFGVSASGYAANMSVKQNALELTDCYPLAARAVRKEFYVDDGLTGADSIDEAVESPRNVFEGWIPFKEVELELSSSG